MLAKDVAMGSVWAMVVLMVVMAVGSILMGSVLAMVVLMVVKAVGSILMVVMMGATESIGLTLGVTGVSFNVGNGSDKRSGLTCRPMDGEKAPCQPSCVDLRCCCSGCHNSWLASSSARLIVLDSLTLVVVTTWFWSRCRFNIFLRVSWLLVKWWPRLFFFFTLPFRPPFPNTMLFPVCCSRRIAQWIFF